MLTSCTFIIYRLRIYKPDCDKKLIFNDEYLEFISNKKLSLSFSFFFWTDKIKTVGKFLHGAG